MEGHSAINVYTDGGRGILSREGDARFCCGKCFYLLHKRVFVHSVNESILQLNSIKRKQIVL